MTGGIFTLCLPVVCAAYAAYMVVRTNSQPPIQSVVTDMAFETTFNLSVTCYAEEGCMMSLNYEGQSSKMCRQAINRAYPGYFETVWREKCRTLAMNEEISFPVYGFMFACAPILALTWVFRQLLHGRPH